MKKKNDLILIGSAAALILLLSVGTLLCPDVSFSENENRYLQEKPDLTLNNVLTGRFEQQMEDYLSDQILGRELWVEGKSLTEAALGTRDSNGVYLCKDGRVVERVTQEQFDWNQYQRNLQQVVQMKESCEAAGKPVDLMLVPSAACIYAQELPKHALTFDEDKAFRQAKAAVGDSLIDLRAQLKNPDEKSESGKPADTYFKTDHHWTGYGAFIGYKAYLQQIGRLQEKQALTYADTEPVTLTESFKGTLYSKVLLPTLAEDVIQTPLAARKAEVKVKISDEERNSIYVDEYLEKKDKYAVFFGGNFDRVDMQMKTSPTGSGANSEEKLLIVKDSFANSFVPYLLGDFREITMVDTRYFRGNIRELAGKYDRVLVLYSINNFAAEKMSLNAALLQ